MEDSRLLDGIVALEGASGAVIGLIAVVLAAAVVLVLLPLLGVALELVLLTLIFASGLFGRVVLGRPWTVEAIDLDDGERSIAFAVTGFGAAGQAAAELAETITASGPPEQIAAGQQTQLPRPTF